MGRFPRRALRVHPTGVWDPLVTYIRCERDPPSQPSVSPRRVYSQAARVFHLGSVSSVWGMHGKGQ